MTKDREKIIELIRIAENGVKRYKKEYETAKLNYENAVITLNSLKDRLKTI